MICPQCGKHYDADETVCRLCHVPLQAPPSHAAAAQEGDFLRPEGIDQTLERIRQDINAIDRPQFRPAGFFVRLAAYMVDNFLLTLISIVLAAVAVVLLKRSGVAIGEDRQALVRWMWLLFVLPNTVLTCIYFGYFHAATGQTVGKWMCGLRVVTAGDGSTPGWGRSLVRCAGYFLSSFFLYAGFFWVVLNRRKRAWHDYLAGTVVIHDQADTRR